MSRIRTGVLRGRSLVRGVVSGYASSIPSDRGTDTPAPITHAWISYGDRGIRWDGLAWHEFDVPVRQDQRSPAA